MPTQEKPIIFSSPMVRAILEGRKTQTRRVVKPQPEWHETSRGGDCFGWLHHRSSDSVISMTPPACPYGQPSDRLWVREAFKPNDGPGTRCNVFSAIYKADYLRSDGFGLGPWKPSIHMPRKYCRLLLDVTAVRVERLQDISEDDAIAEGVDAVSLADSPRQATWSRRQDFAQLWNSLNEKRGYGWSENPWVWVIEFRKVAVS